MAAGHARVHVVNFDARALLGLGHGLVNARARRFEVYDLALAHAFRLGLADADDANVAAFDHFADDGTDLRRADLQADDDLFLCPHESAPVQFANATGTARATVRSTLCTIFCRWAAQDKIALNRRNCCA